MILGKTMESWQWIFVFFAVLMVARIIPRIMKRGKMNLQKNEFGTSDQPFLNEPKMQPFVKEAKEQPFVKEAKEQPFGYDTKSETKDMAVLGHIIRGYKTFEEIRKRSRFDSKDLNSILDELEKRGLMKVQQKKGVLGIKVELVPTEKGYLEYDS